MLFDGEVVGCRGGGRILQEPINKKGAVRIERSTKQKQMLILTNYSAHLGQRDFEWAMHRGIWEEGGEGGWW